jgi:hypothetical protein
MVAMAPVSPAVHFKCHFSGILGGWIRTQQMVGLDHGGRFPFAFLVGLHDIGTSRIYF